RRGAEVSLPRSHLEGCELYATIFSNDRCRASSRATPPHRQNQLQRCTRGTQTVVRNGKLYGRKLMMSSAGDFFSMCQPLNQIDDTRDRATNDRQNQNDQPCDHQLKFPIPILIWRRERTLRKIWWRCVCSH